ncbi:MAG: preprotein translocase subunit YajC, partial [Acidimicrobiales bacterium]
GYFLLLRPQKQKKRRQLEQQKNVSVGDEVLTVGGIVGRVIGVDADRITILSGGDTVGFPAVGNEPTRLVLVKSAVSRKLEPPGDPDAAGGGYDGHQGEYEDQGHHDYSENDYAGHELDATELDAGVHRNGHDEMEDEGDPAAGDGRASGGGGAGP